MDNDSVREIAFKRAGYALAKINDAQLTTWLVSTTQTTREIIADQIAEGMFDAIKWKVPNELAIRRMAQYLCDQVSIETGNFSLSSVEEAQVLVRRMLLLVEDEGG